MSSITSITNPALFSAAPVLPAGWIYQLSSTTSTYAFGQKNPLYVISVIRQSDNATTTGIPFYPSDAYPDAQSMLTDEATNVFNAWSTSNNQDIITTAAKILIGF